MNGLLGTFNERIMPALSLEAADSSWLATVNRSLLLGWWVGFRDRWQSMWTKTEPIGTALQKLSFALVVLLFLALAAPQFANDKEGLALVIAAACGLRLLGTLLGGKERYIPTAVDGIVLLYFAMNLIASCASHYFKQSLFGLAKLVVYFLAYFLMVGCFRAAPKKRIIATLGSLVAGALVVSLYGLYQYKIGVAPLATWEDPTIEDKATRVFSTLGNPNLLAGYLVPIVPISVSLASLSLFARGFWRWLSIPLYGVAAVITLTTFLTGSRGGYIGLFVGLAQVFFVALTWFWRRQPRARLALLAAVVLVPMAAVAVLHFGLPSFEHRFMSIFAGGEHSSNAYRLNVWHSSIEMVKDNWWLGIGTGNKTFRLAYGLYMRSSFDALGTYCVPLEVAVETGVGGLVIFAWLLLATMSRAHNTFWSTEDPVIRWLCVGGAGAILAMMAHGLVDTVFYRPQVQFIFWLAISFLVALSSARPISSSNTSGN